MNGSFTLLVPELTALRYHDEALYTARVHQILLHGFPYYGSTWFLLNQEDQALLKSYLRLEK